MSENSNPVPSTSKDETIGALPSEAKLQQAKQRERNQLVPSDQSDGRGGTLVTSKPRSTKRWAKRVFRYPARPNDGAARHPKWKRPNALKSGMYSGAPLIPGEDPCEFNELHAELIDDWKPSGATLQFAVRRLADLFFRMRRLEKFVQTRLSLTTLDPHSPTFDETWGDCMFMHYLRSDPETCFERASRCLRPDRIDYLKQKFSRSNYQSTSEWVNALIKELISTFDPVEAGLEAPKRGDDLELREASRQWKTEQKVAGCMLYAADILDYYAKESELLEARIVKQTRHCAELKASEEIRSKS